MLSSFLSSDLPFLTRAWALTLGCKTCTSLWQIMKSVRSKRAREKMQVFGQPLGLYSLRATGMESVACLAGGQVEAHVLLQ